MLIYCYFNKEIYINWYFLDVMKIHPTLVNVDIKCMKLIDINIIIIVKCVKLTDINIIIIVKPQASHMKVTISFSDTWAVEHVEFIQK